MGDKSPGIRRPLYKETDIVPNECCRICRIYLGIITRIFHKIVICSVGSVPAGSCKVCKSLSIALIICIVYFCGARRSRRFAGIPLKIVILIGILAIWLAFWFGGSISFCCGATTLGRAMQHNKPLMFGMYFQRFFFGASQENHLK